MSDERLLTRLMLALTLSTGIVNAVGLVGLGGVFPANMTGNIVTFGIDAVSVKWTSAAPPLIALCAFLCGAVAGGRVGRGQGAGRWTRHMTVLFVAVGLLLAAAGAWLSLAAGPHSPAERLAMTALLCAAMGMQTSTARRVGVADVTTVVITSALAAWAAEWGQRVRTPERRRRAWAVLLMAAGAVLGGLACLVSPAAGAFAAAAIVLAVAALGHRLISRADRP
ncbi:YoaK family protein [Nonomuraea sp. NPDC004297]